jgi:uncharacterized damage-inducible protein DinB
LKATFNKYNQLLNGGEYAPAEKILSGLTLEQVNYLASPVSHSIYDELWHTTTWQKIVVYSLEDKELSDGLAEKWKQPEIYPALKASTQNEWDSLVREFLTDLNKAISTGQMPDVLETKVGDFPFTFGDGIQILATHNAYHLGKIVAIRQMMGAWPPKEEIKN